MKNLNLDTRTLPVKSTNLRAVANSDGTTTVQGRAIVFNQPSQPLPFLEYIDPHALDDVDFSHTLLLYGHDFNQILARADAGSLSVHIDNQGLTFKATLPDTTLAHDTRENISAGNVQGCSFGFKIADGGDYWDTASDGTALHFVTKIETVDELTLTPIPAYTQTSVQVQRSLDQILNKEDNTDMNSSNASSTTSSSSTSSTATSSAALTASDVAAAITAAIKPLSSAVSSLVDRQCHDDSADEDRAAKRDDDVDDVDYNDADLGVDDDETDSKRDSAADSSAASSDADGVQGSSAASSSATSSAAVSDSTASSASSDSTRSLNPQNKEDESKMIKITNNEDSKKEEQLRDFAHYLVTREMRPSLQREAQVQGVGLTQGSVLIPESILAPLHETHQFNRLENFTHNVNVTTTTGKQPYFQENTGILQTKEEFDHAKDVNLSNLKFINWDLKTYAGKLALSREVLMDSEKGSSENWLAEAQQQMKDLQDNTNDSLIATQLLNGASTKNATDAVADMKTVLNVNLQPKDSEASQIILTASAYNALDQLKDGFGRPLLQPNPTQATSNMLFGKPVIKVADTLLGKAGDAIAVIAPLNKVIYTFQMGQVSGQFIDNFDIFDTTLGVFLRKDVVNGRPDLVNVLKLTDKSLAASGSTVGGAGK